MQVYLDNAATSKMKPPCVWQAMENYYFQNNTNPGRSGYHLSLQAGNIVLGAREALAKLFNVPKATQVIFTQNVTIALNIAIKGLLQPGDHVLISALEHNAIYRPIVALAEAGLITYDIIGLDSSGALDLTQLKGKILPHTRMIAMTHASNLSGDILPLEQVGKIAAAHKLYFVIDTAQTAGILPVDMQKLGATALCFTGHKHLLGPMGTGGMCVEEAVLEKMNTLYEGGTGSISSSKLMPDFLPDKFESGTINALGLAGLGASVNYLLQQDLASLHHHELQLMQQLQAALMEIPDFIMYGQADINKRVGTLAFNFQDVDNSELCNILDEDYGIMARPGLHCTPLAHQSYGSYPQGALRFSIGMHTTEAEIAYTISSIKSILGN